MNEAEFDEMLEAIAAEISVDPQAGFVRTILVLEALLQAANDNEMTWPIITFPDGWCASP